MPRVGHQTPGYLFFRSRIRRCAAQFEKGELALSAVAAFQGKHEPFTVVGKSCGPDALPASLKGQNRRGDVEVPDLYP